MLDFITKILLDNIKNPLKCSRNARPNFLFFSSGGWTFSVFEKYISGAIYKLLRKTIPLYRNKYAE